MPLVDATGVTLGGTLSNETINELPLNGRNYQNLLSLRPGVEIYPGGGAWTQSTNGIRPEDQNYMVDGLDNNEAFSGQSIINSPRIAGDAIDHFADRRDSGVQRRGKSSGRVWLEAGLGR